MFTYIVTYFACGKICKSKVFNDRMEALNFYKMKKSKPYLRAKIKIFDNLLEKGRGSFAHMDWVARGSKLRVWDDDLDLPF